MLDSAEQSQAGMGRAGPGPTAQDRSRQGWEVPSSAGQRRTGPG